VIFVGILEKVVDDFNVATWQLQMEGARTGRERPAIVDQIVTMQWIDFGDGKPARCVSGKGRPKGGVTSCLKNLITQHTKSPKRSSRNSSS
jgi:hypothetical protein